MSSESESARLDEALHPNWAIETQGLTRRFGDAVAVQDLHLQVPRGCFLGFLGANGAGKSTTIKMLTGLLKPTAGRAYILGHRMYEDDLEAKAAIGVVPEDLAIHERLTGFEYLTFVGRMYRLDRATITRRRQELLEWMSLDKEPKKLIVDYSHGMKKKLALAAALIHDPQVLFLDEPFEGIDVIASRQIRDLLTHLIGRGVTIFLTSHILEVVEKLCTHVAIIHEGKLAAHGSMEELRAGVDTGSGEKRTLEQIFLDLVHADAVDASALSWLR
ncbi:MAG: ABC-2 type transport system ATP-binding protein [Candidatus Paceibacteria bacterium]|jgi:ABC-2 type transport system ATP-binding protein